MGSISLGDLLVGNAIWARAHACTLAVRRTADAWEVAFLDARRAARMRATNERLDDALTELYTAAQVAGGAGTRRDRRAARERDTAPV